VAAVTSRGNLRDLTLMIVLLHTGLRAHEICSLKREHLTLGKRSGRVWVHGKRNKYREVPLNATARKALEEYLAYLDPTPGTSQPKETDYLFISHKTGGPLSERALGYVVTKYAVQAKVQNVSPHDLRHRFGYRMAQSVPLHRLAQIMGHDSLDTTLVYIRGTRNDLQQEVEKIAWT
jgi:integrase/recombinase XerD